MTEPPAGRGREHRQQLIADLVIERGSATAQELVAAFGVSLNTVHRDLDELARRGVVRKFHGGVSAQPSGVFESNVAYRLTRNLAEKAAVARHAAALIQPGMSVMLDDSTTTLQLAPLLAERAPLKVVTNYLELMQRLRGADGISLVSLGGEYDRTHDAFIGVACISAIRALRVDATFLSMSAVADGNAFHQEDHIVAFKRPMLEVAAKRYLLLDHTKLGRSALHQVVALRDFDLVIVDDGATPEALADLDHHGVRYEIARR
jgi:DeoR/GlpR family transcriptional regulator of sugar metabolism